MKKTRLVPADRLKSYIQLGLIVLTAVMPLHAFLVITAGHITGHQSIWAAWKELVTLALALMCIWLVTIDPKSLKRLRRPLTLIIASFIVLVFLVTLITRPSLSGALYGAKTDLEFLVLALIAVVASSKILINRLVKTLLISTSLVVIFGLLQFTFLPHDLLSSLGYGFAPGQTAPYETVRSGMTEHFRFGSTLGGPNQLGTFLILPLILTLVLGRKNKLMWIYSIAVLPVLFITYSRGAWIGAIAAAGLVLILSVSKKRRVPVSLAIIIVIVLAAGFALIGPAGNALSDYLKHPGASGAPSSDSDHAESITSGLHQIAALPLGHGLGTAGPATFHFGTTNIIEDNYLQVGYEAGIIGLIIFMGLLIIVAITLLSKSIDPISVATGAAVAGISVTAIVLPAWTDSSTAITVWILAGTLLGQTYE